MNNKIFLFTFITIAFGMSTTYASSPTENDPKKWSEICLSVSNKESAQEEELIQELNQLRKKGSNLHDILIFFLNKHNKKQAEDLTQETFTTFIDLSHNILSKPPHHFKRLIVNILNFSMRMILPNSKITTEQREEIRNLLEKCAEKSGDKILSHLCTIVPTMVTPEDGYEKGLAYTIEFLKNSYTTENSDVLDYLQSIADDFLKNEKQIDEGIDILLFCYEKGKSTVLDYGFDTLVKMFKKQTLTYDQVKKVINFMLHKGITPKDDRIFMYLCSLGRTMILDPNATKDQMNEGIKLLQNCHNWGCKKALYTLYLTTTCLNEKEIDKKVELYTYCHQQGDKYALNSLYELGRKFVVPYRLGQKFIRPWEYPGIEIDKGIEILKYCVENDHPEALNVLLRLTDDLSIVAEDTKFTTIIKKSIALTKYAYEKTNIIIYLRYLIEQVNQLYRRGLFNFLNGTDILKYCFEKDRNSFNDYISGFLPQKLITEGVKLPKLVKLYESFYLNSNQDEIILEIMEVVTDYIRKHIRNTSFRDKSIEEIQNILTVYKDAYEIYGHIPSLDNMLFFAYDVLNKFALTQDIMGIIDEACINYTKYSGERLFTIQTEEKAQWIEPIQHYLQESRPSFCRHAIFDTLLREETFFFQGKIDNEHFIHFFDFSQKVPSLLKEEAEELQNKIYIYTKELRTNFGDLLYMPLSLCKSIKYNFKDFDVNLMPGSYLTIDSYTTSEQDLSALDEEIQDENHGILCSFSYNLNQVLENELCFLPISNEFYTLLNPGDTLYCWDDLIEGYFKTYAVEINEQPYYFLTLKPENTQTCTQALEFFDLKPFKCFNSQGREKFQSLQEEIKSDFWSAVYFHSHLKFEKFKENMEIPVKAKEFILGYKLSEIKEEFHN